MIMYFIVIPFSHAPIYGAGTRSKQTSPVPTSSPKFHLLGDNDG
jgi:hypothetical protein